MKRVGLVLLALLAALFLLAPVLAVRGHATTIPVRRVLQSAATAVGPGTPVATLSLRNKTFVVQITGTGTVHLECSVDDGVTYDIVLDTTLTEADGCGAAPNRCVLDVPVSCTWVRAPIDACVGCTITAKHYAE